MRRPEHIVALDVVLERALASVSDADAQVADFYSRYIGVLDQESRVLRERANVHHKIQQTSDAIRRLGYVLTDETQKLIDEIPPYSANAEKQLARDELSYNA